MTREDAKQIALKEIENGIAKYGEDAIFMMSPKVGKDSWTWKEAKDSILKDKPLEDSGNCNLIDLVLKYDEYKKSK
jgi:hypothetical protein